MSAQILQFVPRPSKRAISIITPLDMFAFAAEANLYWLQKFNELADTAPCEYVAPMDDSAWMLPDHFLDQLNIELAFAVFHTNQDYRMSIQVKGLADIVRQTKQALADASNAAGDMQASAQSVAAKVKQVQDLTVELRAADAELGAAIGQMSNGGPPLEDTTPSVATTPDSSAQYINLIPQPNG